MNIEGAAIEGGSATNGTSEVSAEASKMTELQSTLEKQSSELSVLQSRLLEAEEALRAAHRDAQRSQELHARLQRDLHEKSAQNQDQVCLSFMLHSVFITGSSFVTSGVVFVGGAHCHS